MAIGVEIKNKNKKTKIRYDVSWRFWRHTFVTSHGDCDVAICFFYSFMWIAHFFLFKNCFYDNIQINKKNHFFTKSYFPLKHVMPHDVMVWTWFWSILLIGQQFHPFEIGLWNCYFANKCKSIFLSLWTLPAYLKKIDKRKNLRVDYNVLVFHVRRLYV